MAFKKENIPLREKAMTLEATVVEGGKKAAAPLAAQEVKTVVEGAKNGPDEAEVKHVTVESSTCLEFTFVNL